MGLAQDQAALAAALTGIGPMPAGLDAARVHAASEALLRKRAGEVRRVWPALAQSLGPDFTRRFADWARTRPTRGSLADGWAFADSVRAELGPAARQELAEFEATRRVVGATVRPRRGLAVRRAAGGAVLGWRGRHRVVRPPW